MLIRFEEINQRDVDFVGINILFQRPSYRHIPMTERVINGFLYITAGGGTYTGEDGKRIDLHPCSVIYLPRGCRRAFDIDDGGIEFYRVDFNAYVDGELALFSYTPMLLSERADLRFKDCILSLFEECKYEDNRASRKGWLLLALSALLPNPSAIYGMRIGPAVKYIDEHFREEIDCHSLAELCYLGTSQFYNLFREKFGKTPLEYRDGIILRRAELLLEAGEASISEIAEDLGFTSASYFSRFFKKHRGISPSKYLTDLRNK